MTLNLSLLKTSEGSPAMTRDVEWEIARMVQERIFPATRDYRYVNAGHVPPVVLQKNGAHYRTVFLEASGPVIGMLRKSAYRENVVSLRPGDVVAAYSDGLCETRNRSGEAWGWPRFI